MKFLQKYLLILVALGLLLSSCRTAKSTSQPFPSPSAAGSETPFERPLATAAPREEALISSPQALAACDLEKQMRAMQPDQIPDWTQLGIDACYDMVFDLAQDGQSYTGTARITYTNLSGETLEDLVLRLYPNAPVIYGGDMTLDKAAVDGQPLAQESLLEDGTAVRLELDSPLKPQETLTLELAFSGHLPIDSPGEYTYGLFTLNSAGPVAVLINSYPLFAVREGGQWRVDAVLPEGDAVVSKTALYLVDLRLPEGWKVSATGVLLEQYQENDQEIFEFAGGPVREFAWTASPAFQERAELVDETRLHHWALHETEQAWAEALQVVADSLELFGEFFGPYPYAELDVIALPLKNASGVEYPGLILIRDLLYTTTDTPRLLPTVVAHEVAHQWWYALVGSDVLRSPWQDEALATFSAQLYQLEHNRGFYEGTRTYYENRVSEIEAQNGEQDIAQPVSAFGGMPSVYAVTVYQKGELFFEALRAQIGDEAFYQALHEYYAANMYQIASPDELLDSFEQTCNCDLSELYAEWGVR